MTEEGNEPELEVLMLEPEPGVVPEDGSLLIFDIHEFSEATDSLGARMNTKGEIEVLQRGTLKLVKLAELGKSANIVSIR